MKKKTGKHYLQKVKAVQDESSHWYIIPVNLAKKFIELHEKIILDEDNDEAIDEFNNTFNHYRTGGSINNVQLYADI